MTLLTRLVPALALVLLGGPIVAGLLGTLLPAFGHLPALGQSGPSLDPWRELVAQPGLARSVMLSLGSGLVSTAAALFIVMLFFAAFAGTPLMHRVQHLASPLLAVPHAAAAFALAFLIAPSGLFARVLSPEVTGWSRPPDLLIVNDPLGIAMTAGLVAKEVPFLFLIALAALPQIDLDRSRRVAASLGYGRIAGFVHGVWPGLYRQCRLAVFAVIAFSTSVVDVAAILGPTTPAPLGVRLVGWMGDPDLSMRFMASAGALLQFIVSAGAILLWIGMERIGLRVRDEFQNSGTRFERDGWLRGVAVGLMLASAASIFAGLASLALWSVAGPWQFPDAMPAELTLATWMRLWPRLGDPLGVTAVVALLSAGLALAFAVLALAGESARPRPRLSLLIYLPLLVPQASFLFGLQLVFVATASDGSIAALVLAHFLFVAPYVFLSLSEPWRAFDRRYEAVAAGLGKSPVATLLRIRLPMLLRALLTALAVGFAVSVGQYLPTILIGAGRLVTITTEAVALAASGNRRLIGVYAVVQMLLPAIGFAVATAVPALLFRRRRALRA